MNNNKFFSILGLVFCFFFLFSCSKSFSGGILEKKNSNNDSTYIQADGKSYVKLGFGKKADIQPYITVKEGAYALVLRGEYEGWKSIYFLSLSLLGSKDVINTKCSKRYIRGFIIKMEVCDAFLEGELAMLKEILRFNSAKVVFKGEDDQEVVFVMSEEQKKVFNLILKKYGQLVEK